MTETKYSSVHIPAMLQNGNISKYPLLFTHIVLYKKPLHFLQFRIYYLLNKFDSPTELASLSRLTGYFAILVKLALKYLVVFGLD